MYNFHWQKEVWEEGKHKISIKTIYGEMEYSWTVYQTKTEQGETAYIYLLDDAMQMDKIGLISTNLAEKIAKERCCVRDSFQSFQNSSISVKRFTTHGYKHAGMRHWYSQCPYRCAFI